MQQALLCTCFVVVDPTEASSTSPLMRQSLLVREQQELKDAIQLQSKGDAEITEVHQGVNLKGAACCAKLSTFLIEQVVQC